MKSFIVIAQVAEKKVKKILVSGTTSIQVKNLFKDMHPDKLVLRVYLD